MVEAMEIKAGFKQTDIGLIPTDWDLKELNDISKITRLAGYEYSSVWKEEANGEIIALRGFNIGQNKIIEKDFVRISNELSLKLKRSRLFKGNVIYPCVGTIGNAVVITEDNKYHIQQNIAKITPNENLILPIYLAYFLMSFYGLNEISRFNGSTSQPNILVGSLRKYSIVLPTKAEQTAIATALNDADALITQLEKLIAKKRDIKQGAMQELLKPKEGCDMKKLGEVAHLQGGFAFKSDLFVEIGIPIIRISDVKNDKVDTSESVCYEPFNIPRDFIVYAGDVLIAMSGATTGKIGIYQSEKIAYLNQRVGKFVVKDYLRTDKVYLSHLVRSEKFKENLIKEIAQGAQPNISGKQIENLELPILNKKTEQTRIAQILSDMDAEIEALEKKLDKYKMIKQGMMQNLLTGRIRLV
jgi:type I restriction enzyme S subunit